MFRRLDFRENDLSTSALLRYLFSFLYWFLIERALMLVSLRRNLFLSSIVRMASNKTYEDAINKLNLLQSNRNSILKIRNDIKNGKQECTNLQNMENYLMRTGVTLPLLDKLSVIHVAGTKGKGSTSAMCESILRHHGYKTGFYSSPHLVAVRERIRLCGRVVSNDEFAKYFHDVYNCLYKSQAYEGDMPMYFAFLTVLAFNVFLRERVDVAVIEVGIGGIVDYTNIVRQVPIVGITALGLDHTSILGDTLPLIAKAKAGIMKPSCEAFTVNQPSEVMAVLREVANKVQCPLKVVPDYKTYTFPNQYNSELLSVNLEAYKTNASLAIQLAHAWMRLERGNYKNKNNSNTNQRQNGFTKIEVPIETNDKNKNEMLTMIPNKTALGLKDCKWPGRYQIIDMDYATFFLDGAHTKESMEICENWFSKNSRSSNQILIFSATGDRDAEKLLKPLINIEFKQIFFVMPAAYKEVKQNSDNYYKNDQNNLLERCHKYASIWNAITNKSNTNIVVLECVSDALINIQANINNKSSILVTGSLHLVGAALSLLDPNLS